MPRSKLSDEERKRRKAESNKRWLANNKDRDLENKARWREATREKRAAYNRVWYANNKERIKDVSRNAHLRRTYGITLTECSEMLARQGGVCAVCREDKTSIEWHVDHCHSSGRVRGVLCHHCNLMLGNARDNPATLSSGIDYLLANIFIDEGRNGEEEEASDGRRANLDPHLLEGPTGDRRESAYA